jgi:hypothetical protein
MGKASMNNIQPTSIRFAATAVGAKQVAKHRRENIVQAAQPRFRGAKRTLEPRFQLLLYFPVRFSFYNLFT